LTEELIDILAADGSRMGSTKPRAQVHADGDWHRTVHVWIMNSDQEVLLQRRALVKDSHPGLWDVSCAGHILAGDTSRAAAVRELNEELGLSVRPDALRYLFTLPSFFVLNNGAFVDRELNDVYLLIKDIDPQVLRLQTAEVAAVAWVPLKTFRERVAQSDPSLVPHTDGYRRLLVYIDQHQI
jgi:isopentenyldiphosphate isomerase